MMLETKKKTGSSSEYQSGCSLVGASRKRAPSADWCRVERMSPAIVAPMVSLATQTAHPLPAEPLEDGRAELDELHGQVEKHVPRHQKHH